MIHKKILTIAICLSFALFNPVPIYTQNGSKQIVTNQPNTTAELLDIWDKVNNAELSIKDPFTIEEWE